MAKSYQQRRSKLQEDRIAVEIGGRAQVGSGSAWNAKSDVRKMGDLRVEAKFTAGLSYKLKLDDLLKIRDEAIKGGLETPVMQIEFVHGGHNSYKLAAMDFKTFHHWHAFSQDVPLRLIECSAVAKHFTMVKDEEKAFFNQATAEGMHGVYHVVFEHCEWKRSFAILEWDLFTTLHKEYAP
jgi:hypothetical protein